VLRGDRLVVDMTTGVSRVESNNKPVQALFAQGCTSPIPAPAALGPHPGSKSK
jgi:lipopolysaccharide export system protein LptA